MRQAGIQGLYRRRRRGCTIRDPDTAPSSDLVNRHFTVTEPNRLWVTDITEHPTMEGIVYCAAVMDAYSRLIVGWSIAEHMRTELVTDALGMAIIRRQPINNPTTSERYYTPTTVRNILLGSSVNDSEPPAYSPPWEVSVTVTTMP